MKQGRSPRAPQDQGWRNPGRLMNPLVDFVPSLILGCGAPEVSSARVFRRFFRVLLFLLVESPADPGRAFLPFSEGAIPRPCASRRRTRIRMCSCWFCQGEATKVHLAPSRVHAQPTRLIGAYILLRSRAGTNFRDFQQTMREPCYSWQLLSLDACFRARIVL